VAGQDVIPDKTGEGKQKTLQTNFNQYKSNNPVNKISPSGFDWEYNRSNNTLNQIDKSGIVVKSWPAVSGPWGKGQLPPGDYTLTSPPSTVSKSNRKHSSFCDSVGNCWWQPIKPKFPTNRKGLGMHPDGNKPGTEGCIGATDKDTRNLRDELTRNQGTLKVR
jgi:hypothetical protein